MLLGIVLPRYEVELLRTADRYILNNPSGCKMRGAEQHVVLTKLALTVSDTYAVGQLRPSHYIYRPVTLTDLYHLHTTYTTHHYTYTTAPQRVACPNTYEPARRSSQVDPSIAIA